MPACESLSFAAMAGLKRIPFSTSSGIHGAEREELSLD